MKKTFTPVAVLCIFLVSFFTQSGPLFGQCTNADFSAGTFANWGGTYGTGQFIGLCPTAPNPTQFTGFLQGPLNSSSIAGGSQYCQTLSTTGNDAVLAANGVTLPVVFPGATYSTRLGSSWAQNNGPDAETMTYQFSVNATNCFFTYHYAVILAQGNHNPGQQPFFNINMVTTAGDTVGCAGFDVNTSTASGIGGFDSVQDVNGEGILYYKTWSSVTIPLTGYIGQSVILTFVTRSCYPCVLGICCNGSHYAIAYVSAECSASGAQNVITSSPTVCGGQDITLTAPVGAASYSWVGPGIVSGGNTQVATVDAAGQYIVNMTTFGNTSCNYSDTIVIPGSPSNPDANFSADTVCAGTVTTFTDHSTPHGSITSWAWDFLNNGTTESTSASPTYTFATAGTYPVKLTVGETPCTADTIINVVVIAPPRPTFTASGPVCEGSASTITYLGGAPSTDNYTWGFNGGTPATGNTQGPYQVSWATGGTKNITLTVGAGTCTADTTVQVVVNPFPGITVTPDTSVCTGGSVTLTATGGTSYTWTPSAGLNDTTTASVIATPAATTTYIVTGITANCTSPATVVVTVNPIPTSNFTVTTSVCAGQNDTITYTGNAPANATYSWNFVGGTVVSGTGQGPHIVTWPTNGTENVTLSVSESGCSSSLTTVPVTVNSIPTSTFIAVTPVCVGSNSTITYQGNANAGATYTWGFAGGTVASGTGEGPYQVSWATTGNENVTLSVTQGGCSSTTTTMAVAVTPIPTSTFLAVASICAGQNDTILYIGNAPANATYNWNFAGGTVVSGTGQGPYFVTWPTAATENVTLSVTEGTCSSTLTTVPITVNATPTSSFIAATPVCTGEGSIVTYTGNGTGAATYTWGYGGGTATGTGSGPDTVSWATAGTDSVTLTVSQSGCSSTSAQAVVVNAIPTSLFTASSPVCAGSNSTVTYRGSATADASYNWNFGSGIPSGSGAGPYTVSWDSSGVDSILLVVSQNGCISDTTIAQVTVNAIPVAAAGTDTSFCSGNSAVIGTTATAGYTYSWSPATGLSSASIANPVADLTNITNSPIVTTYTVTASQNGCSATDAVVVTVNPNPMPSYNVPAGQCLTGNSFNFTAGGTFLPAATLAWNFGANATPATSTSPAQSVTFSATGNQTVSLTVTQNTCINTFVDSVVVYPEPVAGFAPDSVLGCVNFNVCFTNTSVNTANATYLWTFGDGTTSPLDTPCHTYGPPGVYAVSLAVSANGCADTTAADTITVIPAPRAVFTENPSVVQLPHSTVAFLNQSENAVTYLWEFGSMGTSTDMNPQITFADSGEYNVVLTAFNASGCSDSTQRLVIVVPPDNFYVPNVFTPNGDGFNDEFYIYAQPGAVVQSFKIFDRTGEKVHDGNYPWDGTFKGKPAPEGVYVYEIELGLVFNTYTTIHRGSVTLLR